MKRNIFIVALTLVSFVGLTAPKTQPLLTPEIWTRGTIEGADNIFPTDSEFSFWFQNTGSFSFGRGAGDYSNFRPGDYSWGGMSYFGLVSSNAPFNTVLNSEIWNDEYASFGSQLGGWTSAGAFPGSGYGKFGVQNWAGPAWAASLDEIALFSSGSFAKQEISVGTTNGYSGAFKVEITDNPTTTAITLKTNYVTSFSVSGDGKLAASAISILSPNGTRFRIVVSNDGTLGAVQE